MAQTREAAFGFGFEASPAEPHPHKRLVGEEGCKRTLGSFFIGLQWRLWDSPTVVGGSTFGGGRPKKEKAEKVAHSGAVWLRLRHWKEQEGGGKEEEEGKEEKQLLLYTVLPISMRMVLLR